MDVLCLLGTWTKHFSVWISTWRVQILALFAFVIALAHGQLHYSIPEEMNKGSVVGNIVQDFGLDVRY